jgi:glucokinase
LIDALIGFRDDALTDYLNGLPPALRFGFDGALAVAGPRSRDKVALTDLGWSFSTRDLHRSLELGSLKVVNVFVATPDTDVFPVRPRTREAAGPIGIIGPGTGLGVRALIPTDENG